MSVVTPQRIARTMQVLTNGTFDDKMAELRTTPISPPDDGANLRAFPATTGNSKTTFAKTTIRDWDEKIGFFKLEAGSAITEGAMIFKIKTPNELRTVASRVGYVPCWFLPWRSGNILKIKIPDAIARPIITFPGGIDPVLNPSLFLTAAINGCSVFAIGDAKSPNLYHAGASTSEAAGMNLGKKETTEAGWMRLLEASRSSKSAVPQPMGSVGKTDYVSELKQGATQNSQRLMTGRGLDRQKTTGAALALQEDLVRRGQITMKSVSPWGAVFGLRGTQTGDWSINLVRNATVLYQRVVPPPQMSRGQKMLSAIGNKAQSLFGENDNPPAVVAQTLVTAVNLGYKKFFPGLGVEHYADLGSIVIT